MAVKSGFFDASYDSETGEYDRVYLSDDMSQFFKAITGSGIFKNEGNALEVTPSGAGMSVSVDTGFATAYGRYIHNTERYTLEIDSADTQGRIDIVVARLSTLQNERSFDLIVKKGTPALVPVAPSLTRNEVIYELCLAKVSVPANASSITSEMIEDTRMDDDLCGFVSGLGGGAEIIDCTINNEADLYSSIWLLDDNGNSFQPEAKKMYRVITSGKYKDCVYVFNPTTNKYEGIASYEIELTNQEALELWNSSPYSRLSNIPVVSGDIQYTGQAVSPTWLYYDPSKVRIGGTTSATNVGVYSATFEPISGYAWPDGSTDTKYIEWAIVKKVVPIPIPMQTLFNYNGSAQSVVFNNLDTGSVTITNASATNRGEYVVTATLNDPSNTVWSDDTYVQKAWNYKIVGAQNIITLSEDSVTFDSAQDEETITVSSTSGGTPTIEVSDSNVVQASIVGNTITLTPGSSPINGTATVTVSVPGTSVYESAEATITVEKEYGTDIVSWANGTDAEIAAMVAAADAGNINLADYWHIGDERVVRLNSITGYAAQEVTLVLMDVGHYDLVTPVLDKNGNTRYKCSFVVGVKNALQELIAFSNNTSVMGWDDQSRCAIKDFCNTKFSNMIPSTLLGIFKQFNLGSVSVYSSGTAASYSMTYSNNLFAIFADREISPTNSNSADIEWASLSQIEYYKTAANRIRKIGNGGSPYKCWTRSMDLNSRSDKAKAIYIDENGNNVMDTTYTTTYNVTKLYGMAPFGCI
jgi:hypothetical protein